MKSLKEYLNESVLDPVQEKLSPALWQNNKIKKSAKMHMLKKLEIWLKNYTDKLPKEIYLLGSMAGFQYGQNADIDINIVIDLSDEKLKELVPLLPNGHNLPGTEHPVNYYLSKEKDPQWEKSGPLYNVLKDEWIRKPDKEEAQSVVQSYREIIEIARFFTSGLDSVMSEYYRDAADYKTYELYLADANEQEKQDIKELMQFKLQEIIADIHSVRVGYHVMFSLRKEAFKDEKFFKLHTEITTENPNLSINNIIYKYVERLGYLDKVNNIKKDLDKWEKLLTK